MLVKVCTDHITFILIKYVFVSEKKEVQFFLPNCLLAVGPACRLRSAPAMRCVDGGPAGRLDLCPYRLPDRAAARPARQLAAPRSGCWLPARMPGSEDGTGIRRSRGTERAMAATGTSGVGKG